ncbi:MAG: glycosyltransferase [Ruminococcus sp.]|nr:glycosyltransferase [Ruminococcus sp.]
MSQPKVSVIVPVYNAQQYLERCLESLVSQTYKELEIILVDDGSSDNSPAICDSWAQKDSRFKVIHKQNAGAGMARNSGIDVATGRYVTFVDADDYIESETVSKCINSMMDNNCHTAAFGSNVVDSKGNTRQRHVTASPLYIGRESVSELLCGMLSYNVGFGMSVWSKVFDLDIIREHCIRFLSEREFYSEDALFVLEYFSYADSVCVLSDNLYYYFENDGSLSRVYNIKREQNLGLFLRKSLETARLNNLSDNVSDAIMVRYQNYLMVTFKYLMSSELKFSDRYRSLHSVYRDPDLQLTLTKNVLSKQKKALRLFYQLISCKLYFLADIILWCKVHL